MLTAIAQSALFIVFSLPAKAKASSQQCGAHGGLVQHCKRHVVPVGQRAAAGNHMAIHVLAQRLELPHRADSLEVADAAALMVEDAGHLVVHAVQGQWGQGGRSGGLFIRWKKEFSGLRHPASRQCRPAASPKPRTGACTQRNSGLTSIRRVAVIRRHDAIGHFERVRGVVT